VSARLNSLPIEPHALRKDADTEAAERNIADALGLTVEIIIRYRSLDQFETVRKKLMGI
jgi:hypothetical protein